MVEMSKSLLNRAVMLALEVVWWFQDLSAARVIVVAICAWL
jgi:hypothetical protein